MTDKKAAPSNKAPARKAAAGKRAASRAAATSAAKISAEAPAKPAKAGRTKGPRAKAAPKAAAPATTRSLFDPTLLGELSSAATAAESVTPFAATVAVPSPDEVVAPVTQAMGAGAEQARQTLAQAQAANSDLGQAMAETAQATARGVLEINGKVIDALRAQSVAAFEVWRSALAAGSLSEAISLQTSGARQVYETAASHWKDVAETTTRLLGESVRPIQSTRTDQRR